MNHRFMNKYSQSFCEQVDDEPVLNKANSRDINTFHFSH